MNRIYSDAIATDEELVSLPKLKKYLEDQNVDKDFDDMTLLRFLKARNFDVEKTAQMIKDSIKFRESWDLDGLRSWNPPIQMCTGFDWYLSGYDNEGRPVYYAPLGLWISARDFYIKGQNEDCLKYAGKCMDMVHKALLKTKHQNFSCIVDITGATYGRALYEIQNFQGIQDLIMLFREYEANYPETLHKAFIINTLSVFYWGFNIVKPLMTKRTLSKIKIFDTDEEKWKPELNEHLPSHAIPEKLGGTGKLINFLY